MNAFDLVALARDIIAGKRNKKMTTAAIEAALADLKAERDQAQAALADVVERRRTALMDGLADAEIEAIEAEEKTLDRRLERLDLAEPALLKRLDEARSEARRELWKRNAGYLKDVRAKYLEAARQAAKVGREFIALRDEVKAIFQETSLLPLLPMLGDSMVINEAILASWEAETERFFDALPVIDQRRDRPWDGADQPARNLDYRGNAPPPIIMAPPTKKAPPARARMLPDDGTFQTIAIGTREGAQPLEGGLLIVKPVTEAELKTGEDGLLGLDIMRSFEDGGAVLKPGRHRVTPAVAMAAMRAGAADLAPAETIAQVEKEALHG